MFREIYEIWMKYEMKYDMKYADKKNMQNYIDVVALWNRKTGRDGEIGKKSERG